MNDGFLPALDAHFVAADKAQADADRRERVASHWESLRWWDDWEGVNGIRPGCRISCDSVCPTLAEDFTIQWPNQPMTIKAGQVCYQYMAPCYIAEVLDAETFIAVVDYPKGTDNPDHRVSVERYNGMRLRLDILEVWPDVNLINEARRSPEKDFRLTND